MTTLTLTNKAARRFALKRALLDGRTKFPKGKEGIARTIETLGYIQIDTISVIQRAHHHTLWTRRPDYTQVMLDELQSTDRRIFEYWGHAASYLPMTDYRFYLARMHRYTDPNGKWEKDRIEKFGHMMPVVLERIRNEGPLKSKDFNNPGEGERGTWWDWRPAKVALELLYWRGELMVSGRKNFHKVYDLTERVLPDSVDTTEPDDNELGLFLVRRALNAYGIATEIDIRQHIHGFPISIHAKAIETLLESGEIELVAIKGDKNPEYYIAARDIEEATSLRSKKPTLHLLSPFDNALIHRDRTSRLFEFDYTIECYVPGPKRKFGYFVVPILWGEQFAGRIDPKADRKKKELILQKVHIEDSFTPDDAFWSALSDKLWEFCRFNECETISVKSVQPGKYKAEIKRIIKAN